MAKKMERKYDEKAVNNKMEITIKKKDGTVRPAALQEAEAVLTAAAVVDNPVTRAIKALPFSTMTVEALIKAVEKVYSAIGAPEATSSKAEEGAPKKCSEEELLALLTSEEAKDHRDSIMTEEEAKAMYSELVETRWNPGLEILREAQKNGELTDPDYIFVGRELKKLSFKFNLVVKVEKGQMMDRKGEIVGKGGKSKASWMPNAEFFDMFFSYLDEKDDFDEEVRVALGAKENREIAEKISSLADSIARDENGWFDRSSEAYQKYIELRQKFYEENDLAKRFAELAENYMISATKWDKLVEETGMALPSFQGVPKHVVSDWIRMMTPAKYYFPILRQGWADDVTMRAMAAEYAKSGSGKAQRLRDTWLTEDWTKEHEEELAEAATMSAEDLKNKLLIGFVNSISYRLGDQVLPDKDTESIDTARTNLLAILYRCPETYFLNGEEKNGKKELTFNSVYGILYNKAVYYGLIDEGDCNGLNELYGITELISAKGVKADVRNSWREYLKLVKASARKAVIAEKNKKGLIDSILDLKVIDRFADQLRVLIPYWSLESSTFQDEDGIVYKSISDFITLAKVAEVGYRRKFANEVISNPDANIYELVGSHCEGSKYTSTNYWKRLPEIASEAVIRKAIADEGFRTTLLSTGNLTIGVRSDIVKKSEQMEVKNSKGEILYNLNEVYMGVRALLQAGLLPVDGVAGAVPEVEELKF